MKIVFVNPVGALGGAERGLLSILAALHLEPNLKMHLIVGTDGPLVELAQNLGVQVKVLNLPETINQIGDSAFKGKSKVTAALTLLFQITKILPSLGQYLGELRRTLNELKPDIIHSNGVKAHLITALAADSDVPIVWHVQDFYSSRPLIAGILKWVSKRPKLAIAISQAVANDLKTIFSHLPVEVIYNTVDTHLFSPSPHISTSPSPPRVGLVATFARWKGHDVFLESAARIMRSRPSLNIRFCIVGGAIYKTQGSQFSEEELRQRAVLLGIADKVDFLGFQQNIVETYHRLDIVVHASIQPEPLGMAIIEAMACGRPVIVSQAGGAAELFAHNYDAFGVTPGEPVALASAIEYLLDNPQQCQSLSANARNTVIKRFSNQNLSERILAVYRQVKHN